MLEDKSREELIELIEKYRQENIRLREELSKDKEFDTSNSSLEAMVLNYSIHNSTPEEIIKFAKKYHGVSITEDYIKTVTSVTEPGDRNRIYEIYERNKRFFRFITEKQLIEWFERKRIDALGLMTAMQFKARYGDLKLTKPDPYINERYYPAPKELEA